MSRSLRVLCLLLATATVAGLWSFQTMAEPAEKCVCDVLFDGSNLDAWENGSGGKPSSGWLIEDGVLTRKKGAGYIWSKKRFGDFVLDLEFKTEGNSGVFFRTDNPKNPVQTGIEVQVLTPVDKPSKHSAGALYDLQAPSKEASKAGHWNHLVLTAKGSHIEVVLNDEKVVDADLDQWTEAGKNPDGSKNKFKTALKDFKRDGHIGLQDHGAAVSYRNIKVKPL
jgi:hypothetical protein